MNLPTHFWPALACIIALGGLIVSIVGWRTGKANQDRLKASSDGTWETRLKVIEEWRASKSIDRAEFDAHGSRLTVLEGEMKDVNKTLGDLRVQMERVAGAIEAQTKVSELQSREVQHNLRDLSMQLKGALHLERKHLAENAA